MSTVSFVVAFEGPGVTDGTIDVRDLAPALLALGQAVDAANRVINGDRIPARVQARAVSAGCFEVSLDVVLSGWETIRGLLLSSDVEGAKALIDWIGISAAAGGGAIALYRLLAGRLPDRITKENNAIHIEIDGKSVTVPMEVLRIYQDLSVSSALGKLISSLENDRIDRIEFRSAPGKPAEQILTRQDRQSFEIPIPGDETVIDDTRRMALSIRSLAFQEGNKWRLFDGQNVITATIDDKEFIQRVDRSEVRFAKSDILICEVQTIQKQGKDGLKTEHFVKKILEYRPAPTQIELIS